MNKLLLFCLLLMAGFISCKKSKEDTSAGTGTIVGKWSSQRFHMETFENDKSIDNSDGVDVGRGYQFNADGTGTFTYNGNTLAIHYTYYAPEITIREDTGLPAPYDMKVTELTSKKLTLVRVINYSTTRKVYYTYYLTK